MKLYSKSTSERASKGQGGNEFIDIEIMNSNKIVILKMRIEPDDFDGGTAKITKYWAGTINDDKVKGKNQKGEEEVVHKCYLEHTSGQFAGLSIPHYHVLYIPH